MEMVYVPAGYFAMGSDDGYSDEKPVHSVYLDTYWIDKFEVTNSQYAQCVADGACSRSSYKSSATRDSYYGNPDYDRYPVINVDWFQAVAYCRWAGGRLPTEAEWEKAARGTVSNTYPFRTRTYPWGDTTPTCSLVNYFGGTDGCVGDTSAVGSYPAGASPYGAMDMAGNVWEWVADWYAVDYYSNSPNEKPTGPTSGEVRVVRGGSWYDAGDVMHSAYRSWTEPNHYLWGLFGFRCVSPP
jgi:eukaryotic-like serine/threonine-protein kinase